MMKQILILSVLAASFGVAAQTRQGKVQLDPNVSCIKRVTDVISSENLQTIYSTRPNIPNNATIAQIAAVDNQFAYGFTCYKYPNDPREVLHFVVGHRQDK
jgi:hypothetical protein